MNSLLLIAYVRTEKALREAVWQAVSRCQWSLASETFRKYCVLACAFRAAFARVGTEVPPHKWEREVAERIVARQNAEMEAFSKGISREESQRILARLPRRDGQ